VPEAKAKPRESPTYVNLGLDGELLLRMDQPIRQELETLYDQIYGALDAGPPDAPRHAPRPGLGKFIGFAAAVGADEIRKRHLAPVSGAATTARNRMAPKPGPRKRAAG